ncbi:glycosyltransferase [Microbacterium invictum]|uniref:Glycosyltransferase involved in cell wall biosynthesis n=1 Tax=Microbacterium invictum TaxID=515415 RepID=A0AA40VN86_9MICO|nr:glycosyltransferase [Microbacterium invictum]MBB4140133.1 glycosyltransferase involved in cell wall biosynthesis [Microbacterium invictum]
MSVIVPVFNKADDLAPALVSVLSQSLEEIEIIIVDDGSTDDSLQVARSFGERDRRVKIIAQPNAGVAAARNRGILHSQGIYLAFLDPDDWYPDAEVLNDLVNAAIDAHVPIAGGSAERFVAGTVSQDYPPTEAGYVFTSDALLDYSEYQFDYGFWRFIYRRDFILENGILFPPYKRYQDPPFFVRALSLAGRFAALRRPTYVYRVATSTNWAPERVYDVLRGMIDVLKVATENDYHDLAARTVRRFNSGHIQSALGKALVSDPSRALPLMEAMAQFATKVGSIWAVATTTPLEIAEAGETIPEGETSGIIDVSVIVPVYNAAEWLHECLLSVLGQSRVSVELICVDDGSTDESISILREYQALDPKRVRIIQQPNGGLSVARNTGLTAAQGRYICFLDSDDYWRADNLADLVERSDRDALDVLQFDAVPFPDHDVSEADWRRYENYYSRSQARTAAMPGPKLVADQLATADYKPSACLYLIRTAHLTKLGTRFVPGIMHEDNPFTFSLFLHAERAAHADIPIYARRVRASSIMTADSDEASMRGYFVSYLEMHRTADLHQHDAEISRQLGTLVFRIFSNVSARFNRLSKDAIHRLEELVVTPDAQTAYSLLTRLRTQERRLTSATKTS